MRDFHFGEEAVIGDKLREGLTIVVPAYNEEHAVGQVLEEIGKTCSDLVHEIIVVDDGSRDGTAKVAERCGARVIHHKENKGYGVALKTGILASKTEFVLTMDADGQHRAEDIQRLWEQVEENDMVVGHRSKMVHSAFWRMPGKWLLAWLANYLTRKRIPDLNSGFRLMRRKLALKYLHLCPAGFSFSTTITMAAISRGHNVAYVPIEVGKRSSGQSGVSISTGFETFILILRIATLFDPLRVFIPLSAGIGASGVLLGIYYVVKAFTISGAPILLFVTSMLLFVLGLLCDQISQLRLERFE
jgi:glycosyltransferase involved in cell wall biosynthesis